MLIDWYPELLSQTKHTIRPLRRDTGESKWSLLPSHSPPRCFGAESVVTGTHRTRWW
jgi:hypothetical protein